jgi:hypothetical protein
MASVLAHSPRRPFSLHPLIAEAKRRMRRRRALFVVAAAIVLGGGAAGADLVFSGSQAGFVPQASAATYPGPAVRLSTCSDVQNGPGCRSPDRRWAIRMRTNTYGSDCHVTLRRAGTKSARPVYDSTRGGCGDAVWVRPHLLLFGQGGPDGAGVTGGGPYRVLGLDAATGKVQPVANLIAFAVSANERWIAGEMRPKGAAPLVALVSVRSHECRVVIRARGSNESVVVAPGGAAGTLSAGFSPFEQHVDWWRGPNRNGGVSVAHGPGVGFTRDSKGVIVAVNHWSSRTGAYHRKLVQLPLSGPHMPCPAVVTARSVKASALGRWPFFHPRHPTGLPLSLRFRRAGGRISSIRVTVNAPAHNSVLRVQVLRGNPLGNTGPGPDHRTVFAERVRMTNLPSHGDLPAGLPLATWTGALSPTAWKGGCRNKQYEVYVQITRAKPLPKNHYSPLYGAELGSPWFRCSSG